MTDAEQAPRPDAGRTTSASRPPTAPGGSGSADARPPAPGGAPKPKIGDTRPAPPTPSGEGSGSGGSTGGGQGSGSSNRRRRRRGGRGRGKGGGQSGGSQTGGSQPGGSQSGGGRSGGGQAGRDGERRASGGGDRDQASGRSDGDGASGTDRPGDEGASGGSRPGSGSGGRRRGGRNRGGRNRSGGGSGGQGGRGQGSAQVTPVTAVVDDAPIDLDDETLAARRGRERKGKAVGRYTMAVHVQAEATQIAVLEGRSLIEHQVSRPSDDVSQIHGNIYLGKVQNVLPGMEAAFVDIGTPKNAVIYRSDARAPGQGNDSKGRSQPKIEAMLSAKDVILCQVTKNPIAHKGARLTQEVSLPGRFVVLVPHSSTYGISKRLPDDERKRLRRILDKVRPKGHGLIVRTAAEGITASEIEADVARLASQWEQIEALAEEARKKNRGATLLYREPEVALRMIREELTNDFRRVLIDDPELFGQVRDYVRSVSPELAERVELYDTATESLPLFERHHIHEQLHKALDRKVWLPSGGSLIIEHTEALTVIDVNTGKNVGRSSLEQTVFANNLEAAEEVARQLRLRDIGGIIVIDFIDMEVADNRAAVITTFREALARDKTRTQVFDISELGLVEMTRKRIGEGLLESFAHRCPSCDGRGVQLDGALLPEV